MRKFVILLPVIMMSALTACDSVDKQHAVNAPINYDAKLYKTGTAAAFEIDPYILYNMLENKESFVIEFYRPSCSMCQTFEPILAEYINNTNYQWYRFNTNLNAEDMDFFEEVVIKEYPDTLGKLDSVPTVYYIKDGVLSYEIDFHKFTSYTAFAKIANKHFIKSSLYTVSTYDGLTDFIRDKQNAVLYVFDNTSSTSLDVYKTIYSKSQGKSNPVLILYKNQMNFENYAKIMDELGFSYTDLFASLIEDGKINKTVDYIIDDGAAFKEYITSYLG